MKLLKYTGTKEKYKSIINNKINETNCKTYCEPFCGGASIFFNLDKKFDNYIISDCFEQVIFIFQTFCLIDFQLLKNFYDINIQKYGNWGNNKESFYNFRNDMNKQYFKTNTIEEGMFFYIINKSCINSIFRVGKNGVNSAFGNRERSLTLNEESFNFFKTKLLNAKILHKSFFDYEYKNFDENTLLFLDPPYYETNHSYNKNDTFDFEHDKFIAIIKNSKAKIIYTDLYSDKVVKKLNNWTVIELGKIHNIRPGKKNDNKKALEKLKNNNKNISIEKKQVMYCNF